MLRRLLDLAMLACISILAVATCALLGVILKAACEGADRTSAAASPQTSPLPHDFLVIVDWDAGITRCIPLTCIRTSEAMVARRVRQEDLARLPGGDDCPIEPKFRDLLLRDVDTGELHPPSGIWCWTSVDGPAGEVIDGRIVIDAVFD